MHSIKVKLGGSEFEANGEEKAVNQQFADFLKVVAALGLGHQPEAKPNDLQKAPSQPGTRKATSDDRTGGGQDDLIERVFRVEGEVISLNALPTGEDAIFNAVLLVLYGHQRIANRSAVMVSLVLKGLDQSGVSYGPNLARTIAGYPGLVTKAGVKRGTRYGLTNKGSQRAIDVMQQIV
jgi:hypothetical protein